MGRNRCPMPKHTFHPEELALLAAIHAEPREDTPRLVYADWLQEHGEPEYAEFIRLQCRLRTPIKINRDRKDTKRKEGPGEEELRAIELCKAHGRKWCAPIARFLKWGQYLRGIPVFVFESPSVPLPSRFIS
jgi:uncharacterized protein (TIGR02996 family)